MREIKFRVWDVLNKRMLDWGDIFDLPAWEIFPGTPEQRAFEVMQYTGLKDKNGKEIYEGDVVKIDDEVYEIKWVGAGLSAVKSERRFDWWKFAKIDGGSYIPEIIGNVYENPELLEQEE